MSKDEDLMRPEAKIQKGASKMRLFLAPGAADASEGAVYVAEDTLRPAEIDRKPCCGKKEEVEYNIYAEKQPGEGFWSVAPGCGDISEGMVWVSNKTGLTQRRSTDYADFRRLKTNQIESTDYADYRRTKKRAHAKGLRRLEG